MRDGSPLREEGVDDSVSQRIDGQLWDPLEIFSAAEKRTRFNLLSNKILILKVITVCKNISMNLWLDQRNDTGVGGEIFYCCGN